MSIGIRDIKGLTDLVSYFSQKLGWDIDTDGVENIEDFTYGFSAIELGLKEEAFARITALRQLPSMVKGQRWGIFCVEFDSKRFEPSALKKILSRLVPLKRNSANHAVWDHKDLLFLCHWGHENSSTFGLVHFEDKEGSLPQIKMFSCAPAMEDITQIKIFEEKLSKLRWPKKPDDTDGWHTAWSGAFTTVYKQNIKDSSDLTKRLAIEAKNIRNRILDIMKVEAEDGYVHQLFMKFKSELIHDMTEEKFAKWYAETIVYGLFSARCIDENQETFSAEEAITWIPNTNPFLKSLMQKCFSADIKNKLSFDEMDIGNVIDLLRATRTDEIIKDFNRQTGGGKEDPVIHFYEEFLTEFDKKEKKDRGVFYTPQPVVDFIVRAVDFILKEEFKLVDGLASAKTKEISIKGLGNKKGTKSSDVVPTVQVLDPATGTGTFVRQVILQIYDNFKQAHTTLSETELKAAWNEYVPKHLLPRINAFELMMAPYAVAHMKLAMVLRDTGYEFGSNNRLNVYLTNSLEEPGNSDIQRDLWDDPLATESVFANRVKKNNGINVVIGNPPYSGESANENIAYIGRLMDDYKLEPGGTRGIKEKNPKWVNDDYIKFIRYAQKVITDAGEGILAYVCSHGFLDSLTFRGMRWNITNAFTKIYIIDLHGNANKKEHCPDGGKDENVFNIKKTGVCIFLAIKKKHSKKTTEVLHYDLYGTRDLKFSFLNTKSIDPQSAHYICFNKIQLSEPHYFFRPKNLNTGKEYLGTDFFSVDELMPNNSVGFVSSRDALCIQNTYNALKEVVEDFSVLEPEIARKKYGLRPDSQEWHVVSAQQDINQHRKKTATHDIDESYIQQVSYRVFDPKYTYYTGSNNGFLNRPRYKVLSNMKHNNLALCTIKVLKAGDEWHHAFVADKPVDSCYVSNSTSEITYVFPLFINDRVSSTPNLNSVIVEKFASKLNVNYNETSTEEGLTPESIFYYCYAYLYSNAYRAKYIEFLKIGFPRIPYPQKYAIFIELARLGKRLCMLHLEKVSPMPMAVSRHITNRKIGAPEFSDNERLYINKESYFIVPKNVWEYKIGCYQVAYQWLKNKKGSLLSDEDIEHFLQILSIIHESIKLADAIDEILCK